ncbi:MAG: hypothetical protein Q8M08_06955 [Bacteroidales bacterium]|nr:hypothetical protein [Bacteroidales bacterium]
MKPIPRFLCITLMLISCRLNAIAGEIPFTLEDRDRMVRTEQKLESVDSKIDTKLDGLRAEMNARFESVDQRFESVNQRFDAIDKRFDQLFNFLWAFIGIFTAMMVSVFGFAFWDRKLSLHPIKKDNLKMLNALRDYAEHQPKLREILKNAGLM